MMVLLVLNILRTISSVAEALEDNTSTVASAKIPRHVISPPRFYPARDRDGGDHGGAHSGINGVGPSQGFIDGGSSGFGFSSISGSLGGAEGSFSSVDTGSYGLGSGSGGVSHVGVVGGSNVYSGGGSGVVSGNFAAHSASGINPSYDRPSGSLINKYNPPSNAVSSSHSAPNSKPAYQAGSTGNLYYYYYPVEDKTRPTNRPSSGGSGMRSRIYSFFGILGALLLPFSVVGGALLVLIFTASLVSANSARDLSSSISAVDILREHAEHILRTYANVLQEQCVPRLLCELQGRVRAYRFVGQEKEGKLRKAKKSQPDHLPPKTPASPAAPSINLSLCEEQYPCRE